MPDKLTGDRLVEHCEANKGVQIAKVIEDAGYYFLRSGRKSLRRSEFFQALSEAQGLTLGIGKIETRQKEPSYQLKCGTRGVVSISGCYTKLIDVEPGDHVKIETEDDVLIISKVHSHDFVTPPMVQIS